ncbi:MAG TPA: M48 family metalloprotease [Pyrinomonadaceae bacterium]
MKTNTLVALLIVLALGFGAVVRSQNSVTTIWTPPSSREAKTPFAPKPLPVHNIFKRDADVWLADAIEKLECGISDPLQDKPLTDYVSMVGDHVAKYSAAPNTKYQFIVTKDADADAMTAGGGRIYISLGMLVLIENEDELAAILAHEIAHDAFHHAARMVTRQMFWLTEIKKIQTPEDAEAALAELNDELNNNLFAALGDRLLGFARFDELEADRAAFYAIYKAGYNPYALTTSLKKLQRQDNEPTDSDRPSKLFLLLFGSHPPTGQRTFALSWESNFVKMPPKNSFQNSAAFDDMKQHVAALAQRN